LQAGSLGKVPVSLSIRLLKRAIWEERARGQLAALEGQLVWSFKIIVSQYFAYQTEEDQTRLKSQLAELEKQRDEAEKRHEETVDKLFKTGSWPVAPPTAVENVVEEKLKEVVK
jgi:hypothetical protein